MIYLITWFANSLLPVAAWLAVALAVLFVSRLVIHLAYDTALKLLTVRQSYLSQNQAQDLTAELSGKREELLAAIENEYKRLADLTNDIEERKSRLLMDVAHVERHQADIEIEVIQ